MQRGKDDMAVLFCVFFLSVCKTHIRRSQSVSWWLPVSEQMIQKTAAGTVGNIIMTVASERFFKWWVRSIHWQPSVASLVSQC